MFSIDRIKQAILDENLSGWLFFNFRHRDPISDAVLNIDKNSINSRGWFYIILSDREPLKIVHRVEKGMLDHLPGEQQGYSSREELGNILLQFKNKKIAVQSDKNLTTLSYLDGGTEELIKASGINTVSAAPLIQRYLGILDDKQLKSHEKCAVLLYAAIDKTWDFIKKSFKEGKEISEKRLSESIMDFFTENSLITEHEILIAFGRNTSDPHYETGKNDSTLKKDTLIQFDIWARENTEGSVYADISWVGFTGKNIPVSYQKVFESLISARDSAVSLIREKTLSGLEISGYEVDSMVRNYLSASGYKEGLFHRTGHSIDMELHGYGVNIDSVEFPDKRNIIDRSCFSIEPGLYFSDFGMRTEIDCYIDNKNIVVSGGKPQNKIRTL